MSSKNDPRYNNEGYYDPTAYYGTKELVREEREADKRATILISILKFIISSMGFELIERIKVKDTKTGRKYT